MRQFRDLVLALGAVVTGCLNLQSEEVPIAWQPLADIPDNVGFAGPFAGMIHGNLIVAGGANFPEAPPWQNGKKVWHDRVFCLPPDRSLWQEPEIKLPSRLAYGVSISLPERNSIAMLGGSDRDNAPTDFAFELKRQNGTWKIEPLPSLPLPLAEGSGIGVGHCLYLFSGRTSSGTARTALRLDLNNTGTGWQSLDWPEQARGRMHSTTGRLGDYLYVIGGRDVMTSNEIQHAQDRSEAHQLDFLRDTWRLDTLSNEWSRMADLPVGLSAAPQNAVSAGNSKLLLLGGVTVPFLKEQTAARPHLNGQGHEHPSFPRTIRVYDADADSWSVAGAIPEQIAVPVTVPVVMSGERSFILPSGEIKPGIRTRKVVEGKLE